MLWYNRRMQVKRILLTGDDGYNALGTRLLVHFLKDHYECAIAGTLKQQSGVGGRKSIMASAAWGEETIDGVPALWVDGSPVDAIECAGLHYKPFDLVVSGINLGANIGGCLLTSGTYAAAFHSVNMGVAPRSIAISWDVPANLHFKSHSTDEAITPFLSFPGATAFRVIERTIQENLWGVSVVNINLPAAFSETMVFTNPMTPITHVWPGPVLNPNTHMFSYGFGNHSYESPEPDTDIAALGHGDISVSLCQATMADAAAVARFRGQKCSV